MDIDEINAVFVAALDAKTSVLMREIERLLSERPFPLSHEGATVNAIHFEYDWESFHLVAIPLNTQFGYCGQGEPMDRLSDQTQPIVPPSIESIMDEAIDNEDDDFCDELREAMTVAYISWFESAWRKTRSVAPEMRGFLSVHDTIWRTDLDTGEVFREDAGLVKFF